MHDRTLPGLDVARLDAWLHTHRPDLVDGTPLQASLLAGGRSNLTYRVDGARVPLVLRRPPLRHVQATAHDMAREHRVLSALAPTLVPVPTTYALVDDTDGAAGTGTSFFLMARVDGEVLATPGQNARWSPDDLRALSLELAALLAELHAVDPHDVGLADLGRPDGFLDRQVRRWGVQLDGSRSRDVPVLDDLQERLRADVPTTWRPALVHGDYRLDNALVARPSAQAAGDAGTARPPHVAAILDWEMATLGDAAVDLGMLGLYWELARVADDDHTVTAVDPTAGYPDFAELVDAYAARLGAPPPDLAWYRAFAAYKLAVILEGVHLRFRAGGTVGDGFERVGDLVAPLAREGLARLADRTRTGRAAALRTRAGEA